MTMSPTATPTAAGQGRSHDPADLLTTAEVAAHLGVKRNQINKLARRHCLGRLIGNLRVFTPAEVAALAANRRPVGRPRKADA